MKYLNGLIIKVYNWIITLKVINLNNKICRRVRAMLFHNICWKCEATFGKRNPDRLFYVIRCPQEEMGLFAVINYVIYHLKVAESIGREPVVDWQYYPNKYFSEDDSIGKKNVWESFFKQTSNVELAEVYQSRNVMMSSGSWETPGRELDNEEMILPNHNIINKYIKLNENTELLLRKEAKRLGIGQYRFLGVKCRGTDFVASRPKDHAVVPDVEMTIKTIEQKMDEWGGYDKIYLSTEDAVIQNKMKEHFGDKLLYTEGTRFSLTTEKWLGSVYDEMSVKNSKEDDMKNYLISTYILAMCDALIAPPVGGTLGAVRIKGKYEHMYIFRLGLY